MSEEEKQAPQASQASQASEIAESQEETEAPEEEKSTPSSPLGGRSVFAYLAVLFGAAFLLLLFAYLMQQRDSAEIMGNLSDLRASMGSIQSIDELTEENRQLREEKDSLQARLDELEKQVGELEEKLAESDELSAERFAAIKGAYQIIESFDSLAALRQLYADGDIEGAKELLDSVKAFGYEADDHVEEGFKSHFRLSHSAEPNLEAALEAYPPLVEWRELKQSVQDALAEEEKAE